MINITLERSISKVCISFRCKCDATHIIASEGVYSYKTMLSKEKIIRLITFNLA